MDTLKETRLASYVVRPEPRMRDILAVLGEREMTAREIAYELGFSERNATAPRLTEMKDAGIVEVTGKKFDKTTRRYVATYKRCATAEADSAQTKLQFNYNTGTGESK